MAIKLADLDILKNKILYDTSSDQYVVAENGEVSFAAADYKLLGFLNGYTYSCEDDYVVKSTLGLGEIAKIAVPATHGVFLEGMNYMYFYNKNTLWKITENLELMWTIEFDDDIRDVVMDYFGYVYIIYENSRTIRKYTTDGNIVIYFNESDDPSKFCRLYKIFVNNGGGHLYVIGSEFWNDKVRSFVDHYDNRTYEKIERNILCTYDNVEKYDPYFSYHDLHIDGDYVYVYANNYIEKLNIKLRPLWRYGFGYNAMSSSMDSLHKVVFDDQKYKDRIFFSESFDSTQGYSFGKLSTNGNLLWKITSPENITKTEFNIAIYKSAIYLTTKKDVELTADYVLALDNDKVIFETRNGELVRVIDTNIDILYSPDNYIGMYLLGRKIKDGIEKYIDYHLAHDTGVIVTEDNAYILITELNNDYTNPDNYNYFRLLGDEVLDKAPDYTILKTRNGKPILSFDKSYIETLYPYDIGEITDQVVTDGNGKYTSVSGEIELIKIGNTVYRRFFYLLADYNKFFQALTTKKNNKILITKKYGHMIARKKKYIHRYVVKKLLDIDIIVEYLIQNGILQTLLPNYTEKLKHHTTHMIQDMQSALAPCLYNIDAHRVYGYRYDGYDYPLRTPATMIFMCKNIPYINKRRRNSIFIESMISLVENQEITPFLLFVNGRAVKWSNMTIIRDWSFSFIVISNCKTYADNLDCILYPCTIRYGEDNNILKDNTTGFYFDYNGFYTTNPNKVNLRIEVTDKHIEGNSYKITTSYPYIELEEPDLKQISFPENIITFENDRLYSDGRFYLDHYGENIYTYARESAGTVFRSFYFSESNISKNMIFDIPNQFETRNAIASKASGSNDIRVDSFLAPFDFKFSREKTYERNVSDAIKYIMMYKMQLLIDYYKDKMNIKSYSFTGSRIIELARLHNGKLIMHRDRVKKLFDYIIIYVNGELYSHYSDIIYNTNYFEIPIIDIIESDTIEIVHFKNINNSSEEIIINDEIDYIPEELRYDNFLLFATCPPGTDTYIEYSEESTEAEYPIMDFSYTNNFNEYGNYTGSNIILNDIYFKDKSLQIISKRQFHYYHYIYTSDNGNYIYLPSDFKFCTNSNQFLIFKNGLLYNDWVFNHPYITDATLVQTDSSKFNIYSSQPLVEGDIVDIFYIPDPYEEIILDPRDPSISGYNDIILDTSLLDIPFDKELFFVYTNGKKIDNNNIHNISSNRVRLEKEITTEGNVCVHRLFNADNLLKEVFSYSDKWTKAVGDLSETDYATLFTIIRDK